MAYPEIIFFNFYCSIQKIFITFVTIITKKDLPVAKSIIELIDK